MSIGTVLLEQLRGITSAPDTAAQLEQIDGGTLLRVSDGNTHARLELVEYDRFSVTMRALEISVGQPVGADVRGFFSAAADDTIKRLHFLEEPLAVWELDGGERQAQLRSAPPERNGQDISYWEVALAAGEHPSARISRFHWWPGCVEREQVVYPATFSVVARIADGLASALDQHTR